jgi:diguanylate cyclase (GGDEF)-like protein
MMSRNHEPVVCGVRVLDLKTMHLMLSLMLLVMAAVHFLSTRLHPDEKALPIWAWGNLLCGLGSLLVAFQSVLPMAISAALANILTIVSQVMFWVGLLRFLDQPIPKLTVFLLIAPPSLGQIWFSVVDPLLWPRVLLIAAPGAIAMGLAIASLIVHNRYLKLRSAKLLMFCYAVHGASFAIRFILIAIEQPEAIYLLSPSVSAQALLAEALVNFFIMNIAFILLVSERLQARLNKLAVTDDLTDLLNRRAFKAEAEVELARSSRRGSASSVIVLDLDRFKSVNDQFGHAAGDAVLRSFAEVLRQSLRKGDLAARTGGEEFSVLLPDTGLHSAKEVAERIRLGMKATRTFVEDQPISVTVSVGVAEAMPGESISAVLIRGDKALYLAKQFGRDRVEADAPPAAGSKPSSDELEWASV